MRKKILAIILALVLCLGVFSGCGGDTTDKDSTIASLDDGKTRICLLINGNLGDMSFFDSANAGMKAFAKDFPDVEVKVVEMGTDSSRWEPTLRQTANEAYDLIIVGTSQMQEPLQRLINTKKYNDRRFVIFDTEIKDGKASEYNTVHSILFKQNEGGFLAGALAGLMANEGGFKETGFIGGMKIDIINDFGAGFMQGVAKVNQDKKLNIKAQTQYIGDFSNSVSGKGLADQIYQNTNILFAAASQAGQGCADSAKNNDKLFIGVDSDQYEFYKKNDAKKADKIVTSILKRVDLALYEACESFVKGELEYGVLEYLGIKEGKIGYVVNDNYKAKVSKDIQDYIANLNDSIIDGSLEVKSGLKRFMSAEELNKLYDSLDPKNK